jgi:hypothetical protein
MTLSLNAAALLLFIAAAYCAGRYRFSATQFIDPLRPPTVYEAVLTYPIDYARTSHEKNDVILVGDSTCRHGVDPKMFEGLTGLRGYNLGTIGSAGPSTLYIITWSYLSSHPAPRAVVVCMTPMAFGPAWDEKEATLPARFAASYGEHPSVMSAIKGGARTICAAFARHPYDVLNMPLFGLQTETYRTLQTRLIDTRGYWALPEPHDKPYTPEGRGERIRVEDDWEPTLVDLAALCDKTKTRLIILVTPQRKNISRLRDFPDFDRWLVGLGARHPELKVCAPALLWYDTNKMWDHVHLNRAGVEQFMPLVAHDVQAALAK